jgi:hypothetical protein
MHDRASLDADHPYPPQLTYRTSYRQGSGNRRSSRLVGPAGRPHFGRHADLLSGRHEQLDRALLWSISADYRSGDRYGGLRGRA